MKRFFLALVLLLSACAFVGAQTPKPLSSATPFPSPTTFQTPSPTPLTKTIPAATYRALLQSALDKVEAAQKKPTSNVKSAIAPLDAPFLVKRADGQTQKVRGDEWNRLLSGVSGPNAAAMSHDETLRIKGSLRKRIAALDDWTTPRANGYYVAVDAQKVVNDAVAKGRIRVGPPPLQKFMASVSTAIGNVISNFFKWLAGLLPKPTPAAATTGSLKAWGWLWFLFWAIMAGLLVLLLFLAARALSGGSFSLWGIGKRRKKSDVELRDEDAALFQLAPEELRDRADNFAAQGNFREALRHRFISLLVLLDARGTWRYDVRRTNWEHIAALRRDESKRPLVDPLSDLTRSFDRVRYGGGECDENGWTQFQSGVRQIETLVGGRAVAR